MLDTIALQLMSGARVVAFNDTSPLVQEPVDGDGNDDAGLQPLFAMPFDDTVEIKVSTAVTSSSQGQPHAQLFRGRRLVTFR